jgi:hypothetical protein
VSRHHPLSFHIRNCRQRKQCNDQNHTRLGSVHVLTSTRQLLREIVDRSNAHTTSGVVLVQRGNNSAVSRVRTLATEPLYLGLVATS